MSEAETLKPEQRPLLARSLETVEIQADGRNVEMLCAPWDSPATVVDPPPMGDGIPYQEEFARGAFAGATKAPNRVFLEFEHWHPGLSGIIGHGAQFEERDDALYGRFRVTKHADGDKALALIEEGVLQGASVFYAPLRSARTAAGVMRRLRCHLDRVSLCREGAYTEAKVLAVRSAPVILEPEQQPIPFNNDLVERMDRLGIAVPLALRGDGKQ